jgi:flagellar hook-associated protein 1
MSIYGTLNVGKTALAVSQAAIQTTGNNIANAGNVDYTRQVVRQASNKPQEIQQGIFLGTGVNLTGVERQIDEALEERLRAAMGESEGGNAAASWMTRVEAVYNELGDDDISTLMSEFFNGWSQLANKPQDISQRQIVIQSGQTLAQRMQATRDQVESLVKDVDARLGAYAGETNELLDKIAQLNGQIVNAEAGSGGANGLRDNRDALLKELATLANIRTVQKESGSLDVYIGSTPVVIGTMNRGLSYDTIINQSGNTQGVFRLKDGSTVPVTGGIVGMVGQTRDTMVEGIKGIDQLAGAVIFEVNKVHSQGQGLIGYSSVSSTNIVADPTEALNSEAADLQFKPNNGSFVVHVRDKASGVLNSSLVRVDLDGRNGDDTTLESLAADLNAIDGVTATVSGGRLTISSDSGSSELTFSQDTSGTLAALGIGGFFSGDNAMTMEVNQAMIADPRRLAASKNNELGDNQTALAIANLQTQSVKSLNGATLKDAYDAQVNIAASKTQAARSRAESATTVLETLEAQRQAISGVSLDEEALNLMKYQRAYQAAARVVTVADEMLQTLMQMV